MSLVSIGYDGLFPPLFVNNLSLLGNFTIALTQLAFDSANDRIAYVGRSRYADSMTDIYFRCGTVTSAPNVDVRVETVANGRPTGTLWSANTNAVIGIGSSNTWQTATLTSAASLSVGSEFAINIVYSSGTANFNINRLATNSAGTGSYPLVLQDTGTGTWTQAGANLAMAVKFSSGGIMYLPGMLPVDVGTNSGPWTSGSSPDEYALRFQVPNTLRCIGMSAVMANIAAGGDFTFSLWPSSSSTDSDTLAQIMIDGDTIINTTQDGPVSVYWPPVTLSANTTYYLGIRAETANNIDMYEYRAPSGITNSMQGFPIPSGGNCYRSTRTWTGGTAGAWTDTTTTLPLISLIYDETDDGNGSGSMLYVPNLSGT